MCDIRTHQFLTHWILYTQKRDANKEFVLIYRNYSTSAPKGMSTVTETFHNLFVYGI